MLERYDKWLRLACIGLGLILFSQLLRVVVRHDPLSGVTIPEVPVLASGNTNAPGAQIPGGKPPKPAGTNGAIGGATNLAATGPQGTNAPAANPTGTNRAIAGVTNLNGTNALASSSTNTTGTNGVSPKGVGSTTKVMAATDLPGRPPRGGRGGGMPGMGGMPGGGPPLPPLVQARIDRIIQSELLAPVVHPLPMALLGIAGTDVFLRTTSGQTGIVKEGAELGGVKVLRVGMNRVLVEENGEKKELTIFSGFGSESLLPKHNENSK